MCFIEMLTHTPSTPLPLLRFALHRRYSEIADEVGNLTAPSENAFSDTYSYVLEASLKVLVCCSFFALLLLSPVPAGALCTP